MTIDDFIAHERQAVNAPIEAVTSRDPDMARRTTQRLPGLPPETEAARRATPVGETPNIPLPLSALSGESHL